MIQILRLLREVWRLSRQTEQKTTAVLVYVLAEGIEDMYLQEYHIEVLEEWEQDREHQKYLFIS